MSEYADDLFDEELLLDEELFEDDFASAEEDRVAEVSSIVADWGRQNGIELSDEDFDAMGVRVAVGISPDEAFAATDQGRREADFAELMDRIETVEHRPLTRYRSGPSTAAGRTRRATGRDRHRRDRSHLRPW